jgi:hypothetical protein
MTSSLLRAVSPCFRFLRARGAHETERLTLNFALPTPRSARHVKGRRQASEDTERSGVPQRPFTCDAHRTPTLDLVGPLGPTWMPFRA